MILTVRNLKYVSCFVGGEMSRAFYVSYESGNNWMKDDGVCGGEFYKNQKPKTVKGSKYRVKLKHH